MWRGKESGNASLCEKFEGLGLELEGFWVGVEEDGGHALERMVRGLDGFGRKWSCREG